MTPQYILKKSLCRAADFDSVKRESLAEIENLGYSARYAEPAWDQPRKGILFANWNLFPSHVTTVLKRYDYECEWSDMWTLCDGCGYAVNTEPMCFDDPCVARYVPGHGEFCRTCYEEEVTPLLVAVAEDEESELEDCSMCGAKNVRPGFDCCTAGGSRHYFSEY